VKIFLSARLIFHWLICEDKAPQGYGRRKYSSVKLGRYLMEAFNGREFGKNLSGEGCDAWREAGDSRKTKNPASFFQS
jgi:hypothetical protein